MKYAIDGVIVKVQNDTIPEEEATAYVERGRELYGENLTEVIATLDPDDPEMIDLEYKWSEHC